MSEQGDFTMQHAFEKALGRPQAELQTTENLSVQREIPLTPELPVFSRLLTELRAAGVPATTSEFLDLQRVLEAGKVSNLDDLYLVARAVMVKDVTYYDRYGYVFSRLFGDFITEVEEAEDIEVEEEIEAGQSEQKMEAKEEPKEENQSQEVVEKPGTTEEHHGGDDAHKAIEGSPAAAKDGQGQSEQKREDNKGKGQQNQGNAGGNQNKQGKDEGGYAVSKKLEKRLAQREFKPFDKDEIINASQFERVLARLTTIIIKATDEPTRHLDVRATVERIAQNGGLPEIIYSEEEETKPAMMLMFDVGGSTDEFRPIVEQLFKAATETFRELEIYYFHNAIYGQVWPAKDGNWGKNFIPLESILRKEQETKLVIVGDAWMANSDAMNGGLHDSADDLNRTSNGGFYSRTGYENFKALLRRFPSTVWINPMRENERADMDNSGTIDDLEKIFPTYELTLDGLEGAVQKLMSE